MKKLLSILLLKLLPVIVFSQTIHASETQNLYGHLSVQNYVIFGISAGYTQSVAPTLAAQLGLRSGDLYISANFIKKISSGRTSPIIVLPISVGYNIGSFQPFVSYGYQTIGKEAETLYEGTPQQFTNGWKPGFGLSYYYPLYPVYVTIQRQGKLNNISIGIYGHL